MATNKRPIVINDTQSSGAIDIDLTADANITFRQLVIHFGSAPTTAEDLTLKINSILGTAFDTVAYKIDPTAQTPTTVDIFFAQNILLQNGDVLELDYPNTDNKTYGAQMVATYGWEASA